MGDKAARVGAGTEMVIERVMRSSGHRNCLHVSADTAVDEIGGAVDFAAVEAEESMLSAAILFRVKVSHHQTRIKVATGLMVTL